MNTFKNFVNISSTEGGIKDRVGALGGIGASLLLTLDLTLASLSCFPGMSVRGLTQGLRRVMQDPEAITKKEEKNQKCDSSKQAG